MVQCGKGQKDVHRGHVCGARSPRRKPIDRKLIAQELQKRNLLRVAESIQISPNGQFCLIKFTATQIMSTFCTEPLMISENNNIVFIPDYKPTQTRALFSSPS